jgi:hypothetical protein
MGIVAHFPSFGRKKPAIPSPREGKQGASATKAKGSTNTANSALTQISYGVDWFALDGIGTSKEQSNALAKAKKCKAYSLFEGSGEGSESLVGLIKTKVGKSSVMPAASIFAAHVNSAIALYIGPSTQGDQLALLGLLQGMPSPSYDKVGSAKQILEVANEYSQYLAQGGALYVHRAIGDYVEMEAFCQRFATSLTIVESLPGTEQIPQLQGFRFSDAGNSDLSKVMWGVGSTLAVCAVAGISWNIYSTQLETKERARAQEKIDLQAYLGTRNDGFKSAPIFIASTIAAPIWNYVRQGSVNRAKWQLSSVTCNVQTCHWKYAGKKDATFKGLLETVSSSEQAALSLAKLDEISVIESIKTLDSSPTLDLDSIEVDEGLTASLGTTAQTMQRAGLSVAIGSTSPLGDPLLAKKLKKRSSMRHSGTWSITGPNETFVDALKRLPGNAILSSVEFKLADQGDTFVATGRYITR